MVTIKYFLAAALAAAGPAAAQWEDHAWFVAQSRPQEQEARREAQRAREAEREARRQQRDMERRQDSADRDYERGTDALDRREWEQAVQRFQAVARDGGRGDAALYWKAYALNKLGRRAEALSALEDLRKSFANSRWLGDAKALEVEVRQASGQPVRPETEADDDLKLMAINSLMNSDPERAVPLLQKVLDGANPPKLKERALFVLAQSGSPQAREIITGIARGRSNPDLQMKALEYLGLFGGKASRDTLAEIYQSSADQRIKRRILHSFMVAGERDRLFALAKGEKDPALRREAIQQLGVMGAQPALVELYQGASSSEEKKAIINALFVGGAVEKMAELAKSEKDPEVRLDAIHRLGMMGKRTAPDLQAIYGSTTDKQVRGRVIEALFLQNNATALIELARKETDPELKKKAVQQLSLMHSKEATDFMMEILNK
jgi:hypothetical protein